MNRKKINTIGRIFLFFISYFFIVGIFQYIGSLIAGVDLKNLEYVKTLNENLIINVFNFVGTFLVISFFMKSVDKKHFIELGFHTRNRLKEFILGIIIGLLIMTIGYFILIYLDEIFFVKVNFNFKKLIMSILLFTIIAFIEETICRGYILRNLMSSFNKYIALIVSSIIFSSLHAFNPDIDLFSLFNIFLVGIAYGLFYIYTKNLWFPIAMHLSWNLFQSLLGFNVSGLNSYSIIEFKINEGNLINGGAFGFEASFLSIIAQLLTIIGIVIYYNKKQKQKVETHGQ